MPLNGSPEEIEKHYSSTQLGMPIDDWKMTTFEFRARPRVISCHV
jgi:hypothetical protein